MLLAGKGVARAFGVGDARFFEWLDLGGAMVAVIPHPSGISHWWNAPANRKKAARFMRGAIGAAT